MTTPIHNFQDILDAMERDPALRDALRSHILTEELIQLPAQFAEHKAQSAQFVQVTREHNELVDRRLEVIDRRLERVETNVAGLDRRLERVETAVAGLDRRLEGVESTVSNLSGHVATLSGHVGRIVGYDYEGVILRFIDRLLERETDLVNLSVVGSARNGWEFQHMSQQNRDSVASGTISLTESLDLEMADAILDGRTPDGGKRFILAEASITVLTADVETAVRRAEVLRKITGTRTVPAVIGVRITEDARNAASHGEVIFVQYDPGQWFNPSGPGTETLPQE
jgi:tetrahydromethanopterin S-methyltransferase subunit G